MKNLFIYPLNLGDRGSPNPYVQKIAASFSSHVHVVNRSTKHRGVTNLFLFLFQTDIFFLNWVESFPTKKYGVFQSVFFLIFLRLCKLMNKNVVWVLHNKGSHHGGSIKWTEKIFGSLMRNADMIITHSNAGLQFVKEKYPFAQEKVEVVMHPMEPPFFKSNTNEKVYDLLIWGSIHPYKGIDQFLEYINSSTEFSKYKILIVGKCFDSKYKNEILSYTKENVIFKDKIFSLDKIAEFASQSKFVLFTYKSETILSSGVLMDSLRMDVQIIGPDYAAFKDLSALSCITTYTSFENVSSIIENYDSSKNWSYSQRERFHLENSWDSFGDKVSKYFKTKNLPTK